MKNKNFFEKTILAAIFMTLIIFIVNLKITRTKVNYMIIFTFVIIFILCLVGILMDRKKFSVNKVFWYFNLFFLFLAPLIQYLTKYYPWKYEISDSMYINANIVILLCFVVYFFAYHVSIGISKYSLKRKKEINDNTIFDEERKYHLTYLFMITIACFALLVGNIGISGMFVRSSNYTDIVSDTAINSIITTFCRSFPVHAFTLMFYVKNKLGKKINNFYYYITLVILVISNFPTSVTRFWMGAIYIGILLLLKKDKMSDRIFDIGFCAVFIVIFPIFASFKQVSLTDFSINDVNRIGITGAYNSTDYDAYTIIPRMIVYNSKNGITYGKQILGTIFFFVPRSIWHSKPIASGAELATAQNQWYTNISCPYISEGLINFGLIGALLFTFILGKVIQSMDKKYWYYQTKDDKKIHYIELYYIYMIGFIIFLLRGALHHAVVYISGFLLPIVAIVGCEKFMMKKKRSQNERIN